MKKEKHLRIRITVLQMKQLIDAIMKEETSISEFVRQAIKEKIQKTKQPYNRIKQKAS